MSRKHCSVCATGKTCEHRRAQNAANMRASRARRGLIKGLVKCGLCHRLGHNRRTCPLEPTR